MSEHSGVTGKTFILVASAHPEGRSNGDAVTTTHHCCG